MKRRRVKITGIGPVTPAGIGRKAFWEGIVEPVSRVRKLPRVGGDNGASFVAADVRDFKFEKYLPGISCKRMPRHTQFALAAAQLAVADAGLTFEGVRELRPLVIVGASLMDFGAINKGVDLILRSGVATGFGTSVFSASVSAISGTIAEVIGGRCRTMALQSACCSGLDSIGHAANMIAAGEVDLAICGGTEAPLFLHPMVELRMAGLSPGNLEHPERQCRPFDLWRTTRVFGEGAGLVVLEAEDSPRTGYAFVEGYAFASDSPGNSGDGLGEAIALTLANGRVRPQDIECINAWGPGHRLIDAAEARALRSNFGAAIETIPVTSIKGAIGNPLGAAGAIQVASAALGIAASTVSPTVNWCFPDPECALRLSAQPRLLAHRRVLVNSHGLSGTNACLALAA